MKKYQVITVLLVVILSSAGLFSQTIDRKAVYDSLTTLNPEIRQYFPRWKVCEQDLQLQLYQTFLTLGYDKKDLDMQNVEVLAAPRTFDDLPYELLLVSCGKASMGSVEIQSNLSSLLMGFLSGEFYYQGPDRGFPKDRATRDYCYNDIPISLPPSSDQTAAIIDYLKPTNVNHAITLSLFEQSLKFGETGFWLRSMIGNDQIGYHFWSAGESKIVLQRPLYINDDSETNNRIPYLIDAYIGGGYRITSGISDEKSLLSWVKDRKLNLGDGGKIIGGLDFHFPFYPEAGVKLNLELPLKGLDDVGIDQGAWATIPNINSSDTYNTTYPVEAIVPVLRASGQFTAFYHWWLDKERPENYFRFDLGLCYYEVRELAMYRDTSADVTFLTAEASNLLTYKPEKTKDWIFFKAEYRNQRNFPFGASIQISNEILLSRIYIPLFGTWFYLEGKYATPLRTERPYELKNFFMISPVLRLTI